MFIVIEKKIWKGLENTTVKDPKIRIVKKRHTKLQKYGGKMILEELPLIMPLQEQSNQENWLDCRVLFVLMKSQLHTMKIMINRLMWFGYANHVT